jgi:ectoine hydroxylase-related dioxygenase (phytanoyl-CoA dioxygenase family)
MLLVIKSNVSYNQDEQKFIKNEDHMNTNLTQPHIDSYRDNGFVVVTDFLNADEIADWRDAVDEAVTGRKRERIPGFGQEEENNEGYYNNVFIQRVNLWQTNEKMRQLMLDARLGQMAATLAGVEGIRIWHDQALIKQPWANPTGWHLDNPYWSFHSPDSITIWVALDDVTLENGCMWFIPGSHKTATYDNVGIGPNMGDLFKVYPDWAKQKAAPAPMKAGSCSFHNGLIDRKSVV